MVATRAMISVSLSLSLSLSLPVREGGAFCPSAPHLDAFRPQDDSDFKEAKAKAPAVEIFDISAEQTLFPLAREQTLFPVLPHLFQERVLTHPSLLSSVVFAVLASSSSSSSLEVGLQ